MIRLFLVDDHALFREGMVRLLGSDPAFEVAGQCGSVPEAQALLASSGRVDVLLLDYDLGLEKGTVLLDRMRDFGGKVLLVTAGVEAGEVPGLIRRGISGIFLKNGSPGALLEGIRDTAQGKLLFDPALLRQAMEGAGGAEPGPPRFTERERQVLSYVLEGLANKEIAARLDISEPAAKSSLQQLFAKTGVRTRSQLVRVALEHYRDQL